MSDQAVMAHFGLKQTDYETSTLQDVAAAAKEFQRLLNSVPHLVEVEMDVVRQQILGLEDRNHFSFRITTVGKVYP